MTTSENSTPEAIAVLLVDDEDGFRQTVAKRLARRGLTVAEASNGGQCLDFLRESPVDVVVLDVKMPDMSGLDVLGVVKQDFPGIEVLLLTGNVSTADGVDGIKKGAFDYLTKPIEIDHLLEKIRQARDKIRHQKESEQARALQEQLKQQVTAAERLAALGTLSTGVAHEINNPLAMTKEALGYIELVLSKPEMADIPRRADLEKAINTIGKGVDRIKRITHLLLGFVRQTDQPCTEIDLTELMDETIELTAGEIKGRQIDVVRDMGKTPVLIWSDPYQLRQVLINLMTNAIHAIKQTGTITVSLKKQGDAAVITVADTGEGIPEENRHRIFEPFFSTKPPDSGTGLGLYVTKGIINRLGGKITLDSAVGRGTTFCITLPTCRQGTPGNAPCREDGDTCADILKKIKEINNDD